MFVFVKASCAASWYKPIAAQHANAFLRLFELEAHLWSQDHWWESWLFSEAWVVALAIMFCPYRLLSNYEARRHTVVGSWARSLNTTSSLKAFCSGEVHVKHFVLRSVELAPPTVPSSTPGLQNVVFAQGAIAQCCYRNLTGWRIATKMVLHTGGVGILLYIIRTDSWTDESMTEMRKSHFCHKISYETNLHSNEVFWVVTIVIEKMSTLQGLRFRVTCGHTNGVIRMKIQVKTTNRKTCILENIDSKRNNHQVVSLYFLDTSSAQSLQLRTIANEWPAWLHTSWSCPFHFDPI